MNGNDTSETIANVGCALAIAIFLIGGAVALVLRWFS